MKKLIFIFLFVVLGTNLVLALNMQQKWTSPSINPSYGFDFVDYYQGGTANVTAVCSGTYGKVMMFDPNGVNVKNSSSLTLAGANPYCAIKAFQNSTNTKKKNIYVVGPNAVYVIDAPTGNIICTSSFDSSLADGNGQSRIIDYYGDGTANEFMFVSFHFTNGDNVYVYNETCGQVTKKSIGNSNTKADFKIADLNGDGYSNEGVVLEASSSYIYKKVYAFNKTGDTLWIADKSGLTTAAISGLAPGNLTTSTGDEVAFVYTYGSPSAGTNMTIYSNTGSVICDKKFTNSQFANNGDMVIDDINGDGKNEVIYAFSGSTYIFNSSCDVLYNGSSGSGNVLDINTGDLNGDGVKDIIVDSDSSTNGISIYNNTLGLLQSFGTAYGSFYTSQESLKVADTNGDSVNNLVIVNSTNIMNYQTSPFSISIISPTSNQIFSDDSPTARFNLSTDANASVCYWSPNSGSTNYTLTKQNNTYFYLTNTSMVDGTYSNSIFYCNSSITGEWVSSSTFNFEVDPINITQCRNLNTARTYLLKNSISGTNCLTLKTNNIQINGSSLSANVINFVSSSNDILRNINITNISMTTSTNNTLINSNLTNEVIGSGSQLIRQWNINVQVNASNTGSFLSGALVAIYDVLNNFLGSYTTNSTGSIAQTTVNEYIDNAGTITYYTPHNFSISKSGYLTNVSTINFTQTKSYTHLVTLQSNVPPVVYLKSPSDGIYSNTLTNSYTCNSTGTSNLANVTLYIWNSTGSISNSSNKTISGTANSSTFSNINSVNQGTNYWNCYVCDIQGYCSWQNTNYSIIIDTTNPNAILQNPGNNSYNSSSSINFTSSITDNLGIKNATLNIYNSTNSLINSTNNNFVTNTVSTTIGVVVALTDGVYKWFYTIFDWSGNSYTTGNNTVTIDHYSPSVSIITPTSGYYSYNNPTLEYITSDLNLNSTWYNVNGGSNYSLNLPINIANFENSNEGFTTDCGAGMPFNFVQGVNGLAAQLYSQGGDGFHLSCMFKNISLTGVPAGYSIYFWAKGGVSAGIYNGSFYSTLTDVATGCNTNGGQNIFTSCNGGNMYTSWKLFKLTTTQAITGTVYLYLYKQPNFGDGIENASYYDSITFSNSTSLSLSQGVNVLNLYSNDSAGNTNSTSVSFVVDTNPPVISYGTGTEINNSNFSRTNIYINTTWTEANFANITFNFGNGNIDTFNTPTYSDNFTGLSNGIYFYNVTLCSLTGSCSTTDTYKITLDTTPPSVTILSPQNGFAYNINNQTFNISVADSLIGVNSCWFTNNSGVNNYSINVINGVCQNFTQNLSDGTYTYKIYANDSLNNINSATTTFSISTGPPAVTLRYPSNNQYFNTNTIPFNFSVVSGNTISQCQLWGNWTGTWHKNQTYLNPSNSGSMLNFSTLTIPNGVYKWSVWCNDSLNNINWAAQNNTFIIDTTYPQITFSGNQINNSNLSQTTFPINTTWTANYFANITFRMTGKSAETFTSPTYNTTFTGLTDGVYYYNATVCSLTGNCNTTSNYQVTIDISNPDASLQTPLNNSYNSSSSINFTSSITDNLGIKNATLNIYNSSGIFNQTSYNFIPNTISASLGIIVSLVDNTYNWFYQVFDWAGNTYTTGNNTLTIDTTNPSIVDNGFTSPVYKGNNVLIYANASDTNIGSVWIMINYSGTYQNITVSNPTGITYMYNLSNSNYLNFQNVSWKWFVNDTVGHLNNTNLNSFIPTNRNPYNVTIITQNNSFIKTDSYVINFTAIDPDSDVLNYSVYISPNGTGFTYFGSTTNNNITLTGYNTTDTAVNYYYIIANDSSLSNQSSTYTFTIDKTSPIIEVTTPVANSIICNPVNIGLTYSVQDSNIDYCMVSITYDDLNGNYPIVFGPTRVNNCAAVTAYGRDRALNFINITAYDKAGNSQTTYSTAGDFLTVFQINQQSSTCTSSPNSGSGNGGNPSTPTTQNETVKTFCGDGVCQKNGNDYGLIENIYSCNADCQGFNFDEFVNSLTSNCFSKNENLTCFWKLNKQSTNSVCGDNICQKNENFWTCSKDCGHFNLETTVTNCFSGAGPCFWSTNLGYYFIIAIILLVLAAFLIKFPYENKKVNTVQYVKVRYNKLRKKRKW